MKTRIIHTQFWNDEYILGLNLKEAHLFFYYLTNEYVNIIHCFEIPPQVRFLQSKVGISEIAKIDAKFEEDQKINFYRNWIFLRNAKKFESFTGDSNETAKAKTIKIMSSDVLAWYRKVKDTPVERGGGTPAMTGTRNKKSEVINHKSEIRNKKSEEELQKFVDGFNFRRKTKFKPVDSLCSNFQYWREQYNLEEMISALDKLKDWWAKEPTPTLVLRRYDKQREPVDYIGELLNWKKKRPGVIRL